MAMMTDPKQRQASIKEERRERRTLTSEQFRELVREGEELGREFDRRTAKMQRLTADDLKMRSR